MTPRTMVERVIREHKAAAEADAQSQERELLLLLEAHEHYDRERRTTTVLLSQPDFRRVLRLSRIVDVARGLPKHATVTRLTESITGRRVG